MNHITWTEIAAVTGLIAVIVMATIMLTMAVRARTFSTPERRVVAVESGAMPIDEVRNVAQ